MLVLVSAGNHPIDATIPAAAITDPGFVTRAASRFGDQCIVASIDYREEDGAKKVYARGGHQATGMDATEWALRMQDAHAGEILLTSIDRDGTMNGYDLDLIAHLSDQLDVPLIASSGAGSLADCKAALDAGASAITISSMFIFTDHSPIKVRTYLSTNGVPVRNQKGSRS